MQSASARRPQSHATPSSVSAVRSQLIQSIDHKQIETYRHHETLPSRAPHLLSSQTTGPCRHRLQPRRSKHILRAQQHMQTQSYAFLWPRACSMLRACDYISPQHELPRAATGWATLQVALRTCDQGRVLAVLLTALLAG